MLKRLFFLTVLTLTLVLSGCHKTSDPRLVEISETVSDHPREALEMLDSIDVTELSVGDRHFRDFLLIKARDKAYITHQSDSLYLDVLKYYDGHKGDKLYPEVLYYGGRVYSDLGDYPTALDFYQQARNVLSKMRDNEELKSRISSQTAQLLSKLRLYESALPYVEESIEYNNSQKQVPLSYNYQWLGTIYMHLGDYDKSLKNFHKALELAQNAPDSALLMTLIADLYYKKGEINEALKHIRNKPTSIDNIDLNYILATSAQIYQAAEMPDSARILSEELLDRNSDANKLIAQHIIVHQQIDEIKGLDSLKKNLNKYVALLESRYNKLDNEAFLIQNSMYNYSVHEKEMLMLKSRNSKMKLGLLSLAVVLFLLILIFFFVIKYKDSKKSNRLQRTIRIIDELLNKHNDSVLTNGRYDKRYQQLLDELNEKLNEVTKVVKLSESTSGSLVNSEIYKILEGKIRKGIGINYNSELWMMIEEEILKSYPQFKKNLLMLTKSKLTDDDLKLSFLIKMGFSPSEIAKLLCKKENTVTYRRKKLLQKLFPDIEDVRKLDYVVRLI